MSDNLKLMSIILLGLSLCLLTGCSGEILKSRNDILDEAAMTILKALENGDAEAIKELFSKEALEQVENIDDEIQAAIDFFEGSVPKGSLHDISVPDDYPAYRERASTRHGVTVIENTGSYSVETDKARYAMRVTMYSRNDENTDEEGVVLIEIGPYVKRKQWYKYASYGDAGVFIQDADTESITEEMSEEDTENEDWDSYYDEEDTYNSYDFLFEGHKWFGGEEYGYIQIPDDCEEFTEMTNENRPNMIMMRNTAQTVIISLDYFDEVTSDEDAKNMADQIAANAVKMGADSFYDYEGIRLGDYMAYERYGTIDEATETTVEYCLDFYMAYIPELNRGVYISVEGAYEDVMYVMGMIEMTYTATK